MNTLPQSPTPTTSTNRESHAYVTRRPTSGEEAAYDAELVRRFNQGDEPAFLEIMSRYRERTLTLVRTLVRDHGDAEEITQDTFIRAYRGLSTFRGDSSLATWLHRIAVNLARNRYWYFYRRRRYDTLSLDCPLADDSVATFTDLVATEDPDPARLAATDEFRGLVGVCMDKLPPCHREILLQRTVHHRSYEEIASSLGITVGTVKSRIARARKNVRALLAEMCPEFSIDTQLAEWFDPMRDPSGQMLAVA